MREISDNFERIRTLDDNYEAAKEAKKEVVSLLQHVKELSVLIKCGTEKNLPQKNPLKQKQLFQFKNLLKINNGKTIYGNRKME